jgi:hypothetical protein
MTTALPLRISALFPSLKPVRGGWHALAQSALVTPFYAKDFCCSALEEVVRSGEPADLRRFPVIELNTFYQHFREFENRAAHVPPQGLDAGVWSSSATSCAIRPWFALSGKVDIAEDVQDSSLARAQAVAGPVETLKELCSAVTAGPVKLPQLRFGAIAFAGISRSLLNETDREMMWRVFRVPIYVQFRGFRGELLARECEHRNGLHVLPEAAVFEQRDEELLVTSLLNLRFPALRLATGIYGRIDRGLCACGNPEPRLTGLVRML